MTPTPMSEAELATELERIRDTAFLGLGYRDVMDAAAAALRSRSPQPATGELVPVVLPEDRFLYSALYPIINDAFKRARTLYGGDSQPLLPDANPFISAIIATLKQFKVPAHREPQPPTPQSEIADFEQRLRERGAPAGAALFSLVERVGEFVDAVCRNGGKSGRADYTRLVPLDQTETLRIAYDEFRRLAPRKPAVSRCDERCGRIREASAPPKEAK